MTPSEARPSVDKGRRGYDPVGLRIGSGDPARLMKAKGIWLDNYSSTVLTSLD